MCIYTIWFLNANGKIVFDVLDKRVTGKKAKYRTAFIFMLDTVCALFRDTFGCIDIPYFLRRKFLVFHAYASKDSCLS